MSTQVIEYISKIEQAYKSYLEILPLDLSMSANNQEAVKSWQNNNQFDIAEFSRQIWLLCHSVSIDSYVKVSHADFDNLAAIIYVAKDKKIVELGLDGTLNNLLSETTLKPIKGVAGGNNMIVADSRLNQFPCDYESTMARIKFIMERYPFSRNLKVAIIGEDDFLSIEALKYPGIETVVIEKDERIIEKIRTAYASKGRLASIFEIDIAKEDYDDIDKAQTFITDPPYTLHGALAFIHCGLSIMAQRENTPIEFYVVLNPTMMGRHLFELLSELNDKGIYLSSIRENFSQYRLPTHFDEYERAIIFLNNMGVRKEAIEYSSSSNLYVFTARDVNLFELGNVIDESRLYEHYI